MTSSGTTGSNAASRQRRRLLSLAAGAALPMIGSPARAQAFPSRPLRIVVPFPPGGTTDVVARIVGQRLSESLGQTVVIENRAGAGGAIGADAVAKAAPDGHTMLMHNITFPLSSVAQALSNRSPFNIDTDFAGVSIAVYVPLVLTAHPSVPARDLRELAELLSRDRSLQYNYGSTGPGSAMHVLGEAYKSAARVEMQHVPFRGAAPLKQELLSGRIQVGGDQLSTSLGEIRAGTLKALASTSSGRIPSLPDVPTVRELGYPGLELEGWNGLFVPAKTPREIVARLSREVAAVVRLPDVTKRFIDMGAVPVGSAPAEQDAILRRQMDQFRDVIRSLKIDQ